MEQVRASVEQFALAVALTIELVMVVIIVVGSLRALWAIGHCLASGRALAPNVRQIWLHYAAWILLALEFALAADLIETIVAPGWTEIGQLGAIAVIRIALGYFLGRDIAEIRESPGTSEASEVGG